MIKHGNISFSYPPTFNRKIMVLTLFPLKGFELRNETKLACLDFWSTPERLIEQLWKPEGIYDDCFGGTAVFYYFSSSLHFSFGKDFRTLSYIEVTRHFPGRVELFGLDPFEISAAKNLELLNKKWSDDQNNSERWYSYVYNDIELSLWRPILPTRSKGDDFENGRKFTTVWIWTVWTWSSDL